jgi:predicted amidophosphoribosyltransferase
MRKNNLRCRGVAADGTTAIWHDNSIGSNRNGFATSFADVRAGDRVAGDPACRIGLLDAVLPPRCASCGELVETAHALCSACWPKVRFITEPLCTTCGTPFEFEVPAGTVCAACAVVERPFGRARAAIAYDDGSRGFILAFKHGDRTDAARLFAPWMAHAGRELLVDADLLVPVPLHWTRLLARRYNQAALLAQAVGRLAKAKVAPDLLKRRKRTPSLAHSGARERAETVRGAFVVPAKRRPEVEGGGF